MAGQSGKKGKKGQRFGCKQKHGHSRAAYFARAPHRIAANKARRIAKAKRAAAAKK